MAYTGVIREKKVKGLPDYTLVKEINYGKFGRVYSAMHNQTKEMCACKFINYKVLSQKQILSIKREIEIMKMLHHPGIIRLKESLETEEYFVLVMELMSGGDLFDRLEQQSSFRESDAKNILLQVAKAVKYMHDCGIVHRDLKIENIMFVSKDSDVVKLGDFGLSKLIGKGVTMTPVGTLEYMPPEIVEKKVYSTNVDIWSLGCLAYILLYGSFPFYEETVGNKLVLLKDKIKSGYFAFPTDAENVSDEAKDLIKKALDLNPATRLNINKFLAHPWLQNNEAQTNHELPAPAAVRTAKDRISLRELLNFGLHLTRQKDDEETDPSQEIAELKIEEGGKLKLPSIFKSKLMKKREEKSEKGKKPGEHS